MAEIHTKEMWGSFNHSTELFSGTFPFQWQWQVRVKCWHVSVSCGWRRLCISQFSRWYALISGWWTGRRHSFDCDLISARPLIRPQCQNYFKSWGEAAGHSTLQMSWDEKDCSQTSGTENEFITVIRPVLLCHLSPRLYLYPTPSSSPGPRVLNSYNGDALLLVIKACLESRPPTPSSANLPSAHGHKGMDRKQPSLGHTEDGFCWPSSLWRSHSAGGCRGLDVEWHNWVH